MTYLYIPNLLFPTSKLSLSLSHSFLALLKGTMKVISISLMRNKIMFFL